VLQPPPSREPHVWASAAGRTYALIAAVLLATSTLLVHGWSLGDGTVLDDYWHQKCLREYGWSFSELIHSAVIDTRDLFSAWWQQKPCRWTYPRPFFILTMKAVYALCGYEPVGLHALSLLLHYASAVMVWRLCLWLTGSRFWSVIGGLIFVVYPHNVVSVAWPSSQNVVIQNALMLAALLLYLRASGLRAPVEAALAAGPPLHPSPPLRRGAFAGVLALWLLGLFTRENALMLPAILLALDGAFGGRRHAWARCGVYALFAAIAVAFLIYRGLAFEHSLPDVYMRRPADDYPEYGLWWIAKLLHYVCASIWLAPMVVGPTGRYNPWTEAPLDCLLMLAIVAAVLVGYSFAARHARGGWIWPAWILLAVLPVVPVIATPHSGYLCAAPFAIGAVLGPGARTLARRRRGRVRFWSGAAALLYLAGMSVMTLFNRWQWTGVIGAERYATEWTLVSPPTPQVTDVFYLNLPFVNVYNRIALLNRLGPWFERVRHHVLAFAPDPVMFEQRTVVEQLGAHSFALRIDGQAYFSRLMGRFLIQAFRRDGRFHAGDVVRGDKFDVRVVRADEQGVWELVFTFREPLASPQYCFYVTTPDCAAARLRFRAAPPFAAQLAEPAPATSAGDVLADIGAVRRAGERLAAGDSTAAQALFATIAAGKEPLAAAAEPALRPVLEYVARATAAPVQDLVFERRRPAPDEWRRIHAWWRAYVDDRTLAEVWLPRQDFDRLIKMREEVPHARMWAGKVIRTDLYLTGPPFPGPR